MERGRLDEPTELNALTSEGARVLSNPTLSPPIWSPRSPRWLLQCLGACDGYVMVQGGAYRVNKVADDSFGVSVTPEGDRSNLSSATFGVSHSHSELQAVQASYARYESTPREIRLEPIQSVVKISTRVPQLYSNNHDQLKLQLALTAEFIYETKENLCFNHPEYGLLNNVHSDMKVRASGPPTPDVLDDLLARVWKRPDMFVLHPQALAEFRKQATANSITLDEVRMFGSSFSCFRCVPLVPSNKLGLSSGAGGSQVTDVLLMRLGLEKQGVICLCQDGLKASPMLPYITVEEMRTDDNSVANYLLTTYCAMAVLSPGALASAEVSV